MRLKERRRGICLPVVKPSCLHATRASRSSKLVVQTAPQAPSQKTCTAPVAKPLTSTLLTSLIAPSSPAEMVLIYQMDKQVPERVVAK